MKVSRANGANIPDGSLFHSLVVLGRKDSDLYCLLQVIRDSCLLCPRRSLDGGGVRWALILGVSMLPLMIFCSMVSRAAFLRCCKGDHISRSWIASTLDVLLYGFTTKRVALLCAPPIFAVVISACGSHMVAAYSSLDLTRVFLGFLLDRRLVDL